VTNIRAWVWGVLAAAFFWVALVAFGAARTDYSQLTKAVSELGAVGAPHALAWNVFGFMAPGLLLAACGVAMAIEADVRRVFPAVMRHGSPQMQAPSTVGHVVMLLLSSVCWLLAIGVLLRTIMRDTRLRRLLKPFVLITIIAVSGLAANVLHDAIPSLANRPGLAQRLGFAGYFLWYVSLSLWIARSMRQYNSAIDPISGQ
jgi:hypothetical protein